MATQQNPDEQASVSSPIGKDSVRSLSEERTITYANVTWTVCEVVDDDTNTSTLVFSCSDSARRVRKFPKHWRTLSDRELYLLSWTL